MTNNICCLHFSHPFILYISWVLVLVSFKTTTARFNMTTISNGQHHINKCIDKERHALLHFKSYINQDPFGRLSTWTDEEEEDEANKYCCNWRGVTCNNVTGHVTTLFLNGWYLEGKISPSLMNLTHLNNLDLSLNSFNGTIPMFIGSMTQLRYLNLGGNDFTGTVPSELGNLMNLQELLLDSLTSSTIENLDWLSHLSQLEYLDMSGTSLRKVDNWVNVILSFQKPSIVNLGGCNLSQVVHPYSYSSINSSYPFSSSIVRLYLTNNNLNSSMYHWLFPLTGNRLEHLDLSRNKLDGIPKYLGNLCRLSSLYFSDNSMPIKFPDFLSNLYGCTSVTLQKLYAPMSQFTGSLYNIQNFSSIQSLYLPSNKLNGTLTEVWQLPKLQILDLSSNFLTGAIFENIGKSVNLSNSSLEGVPLEDHASNLSNVQVLDLSSCTLGPHFPKWIQKLKNLTDLNIANTKISDAIPLEFWNMWPSWLTNINLSFNNISGLATDLLSSFDPGYSSIDLSSNNFYGPILNVSSSLIWLDLSKNNFSGEIYFVCQIADGLLDFLDLSYNSFFGQIPDCLWHFKYLSVLSLGHNNLSGRLPASIKHLIGLQVLYIYNNSFSGELPSSLANCSELTFLDLGANTFSGNIPVWIGQKLPWLYALSLTSNNFFGTIPLELCRLQNLQVLDLSMNKFHGAIPSCLNNITSMVQDDFSIDQNVHSVNNSEGTYVDRAMIKWQGNVRELRSTLGLVKIINLSGNNLTGKIPNELTDLRKLIALDLSMNALFGEIPLKIGEMKELQILDLSRNNLQGEIPSSMSHMTFLNYLDVSYNNLSGRIPSGTQLQSFEPSRYIGNAGLCGLPVSKYCPGDKELEGPPVIGESDDDRQDKDDLQRWFYIGGASGFATGFCMTCGALFVNRGWRNAIFYLLVSLKDWVYVKVVVFVAKLQRGADP